MPPGQILESTAAGKTFCFDTGSGLIDPEAFACRASDLQPARVEMAADDLKALGQAVRWEMTGIAADWSGMRPWYQAPEQERVLALMEEPAEDARALQECFHAASGLLVSYAGQLSEIQRVLVELEDRASRFRLRVRDGVPVPVSASARPTLLQSVVGLLGGAEPAVIVPWFEDAATVAANDALLAEYAAIIARLTAAADEVEEGVRALLTEPSTLPDAEPVTADSLSHPELHLPWGYPRKEQRNVVEQIAYGFGRFADGVVSGVMPLLGYDARTGAHSLSFAMHSGWAAAGVLGSAVVSMLAPPEKVHLVPPPWRAWLRERHRTASVLGLIIGVDTTATAYGGSALHQWRDDPYATGIEVGLNVLTMFVPTASAARVGRLAGRTARVTQAGFATLDFLLPGGSQVAASGMRAVTRLGDDLGFGGGIRVDDLVVNPAQVIDGVSVEVRTPLSDEVFGGGGGASAPPGHYLTAEQVLEYQALTGKSVDPELVQTYGSGLATHPGFETTQLPAQSFSRTTQTNGWRPLGTSGSAESIAYQSQVTGVGRLPDGKRPEYTAIDDIGTEVDFDGHVVREQIAPDGTVTEQEVFIEAKFDFHDLSTDPNGAFASRLRQKLLTQAESQVAALPAGARLEWHVSDPLGAAALEKWLLESGLGQIHVEYTPVA